MLKLVNVSKYYYNQGIISSGLYKINLEFNMGEFVVITGESGSGKTTLLNVISGIDMYQEGEMYINGLETSHFTKKDFEDYRRNYIANIFQSFNLVNSYTVYQNIELVMLLNGHKKSEVKDKILDMIDKVNLTEFKNTKVSKLSGGQKQRVAIARAMVQDTPIIIADEPTGNLDTKSAEEVIKILREVAKNKLVIIVSHNIEQVKDYATRIIKIHDGKVLEDNKVRKYEKSNFEKKSIKNIRVRNKLKLGVRNTFNVFSKFLLIFIVFLFLSTALLLQYTSYVNEKTDDDSASINNVFSNSDGRRIIVNKANREAFTEEDFAKIKEMPEIDKLVKQDVLLDEKINLKTITDNASDDEDDDKLEMVISGIAEDISSLKSKLVKGKMPENNNEVVIEVNKRNFMIDAENENLFNSTYKIEYELNFNNQSEFEKIDDMKIVGIAYNNDLKITETKIYLRPEMFNNLNKKIYERKSTINILLDGKNLYGKIMFSDKVKPGEAYVNDVLKYNYKNFKILNKILRIDVENIYFKDNVELKIAGTYGRNTLKKYIKGEKYTEDTNFIFVNKEDIDKLYDKPTYQISVFTKDKKEVGEVLTKLNSQGYNAKDVTRYNYNPMKDLQVVVFLFKTFNIMISIVVLFFISYVIIKIILKSRNTYYTILRMLGANIKDLKQILDIELVANSSLAYLIVATITILSNMKYINVDWLYKITNLITYKELIAGYIMLILMVKVIAKRFSKKIFKDSVLNTMLDEEL